MMSTDSQMPPEPPTSPSEDEDGTKFPISGIPSGGQFSGEIPPTPPSEDNDRTKFPLIDNSSSFTSSFSGMSGIDSFRSMNFASQVISE